METHQERRATAMAIIRWYDHPNVLSPMEQMERLQREMNQLLSGFTGRTPQPFRVGVFPPINLSEDANTFYVRAELPGIKAEDIDISVEGDTLTLRGERKLAEASGEVSYHRRERESGKFRRIITLTGRIKPDEVQAIFKDGVLKIILPKAEEARPKQIKVAIE
jgi:HSP20 family protein